MHNLYYKSTVDPVNKALSMRLRLFMKNNESRIALPIRVLPVVSKMVKAEAASHDTSPAGLVERWAFLHRHWAILCNTLEPHKTRRKPSTRGACALFAQ